MSTPRQRAQKNLSLRAAKNLGEVEAGSLGFGPLAVSVTALGEQGDYRDPGQLRLRRLDELAADPILSLPQEWAVQGLIALGSFAVLYGTPKIGKTTLVAHLARCIAENRSFLGRAVTQSAVLYFDLERAPKLTAARLLESGWPPIPSELHVYNGPAPRLDQIREALLKTGARFVVVDTLQRFFGLDDENDAAKVTKALSPLSEMAHELGVTFLLTHHDRKAGGKNGSALRGSNALLGVADLGIHMQRSGDTTDRTLNIVSNYDMDASEVLVRLETNETGRTYVLAPTSVDEKNARMLAALGDGELDADTLAARLGCTRQAILGDLAIHEGAGLIVKRGRGRRGDPYLYSRTDSAIALETSKDRPFTETQLKRRSHSQKSRTGSLANQSVE